MGIIYDADGIPDWQSVRLTEDEIDAMCAAADRRDTERANRIVEKAYERLYAERGGETVILRMRPEGIRHVPMLICSYCIKEIKASDLASIAYDLEGEGEKRIYSLHNHCIDSFERQTKILTLGTVPLECFPIYFMNVMGIDFQKASDHANALSRI